MNIDNLGLHISNSISTDIVEQWCWRCDIFCFNNYKG